MLNFPTIIAIRQVSKCLHLKHFMGESAEPHSIGPRPGRDNSLLHQSSVKLERMLIYPNAIKGGQSQQKSYADNWCRDLTFEINDFVYLKVSPLRGTCRFGVWGKLAPRYVGPYRVLARMGKVAYKLELVFIMFSMCPNSKSASEFLRIALTWKTLISNPIFLTKNILSASLMKLSVPRVIVWSKCSKFSGAITLKKRPRGNAKINSEGNFLLSFKVTKSRGRDSF